MAKVLKTAYFAAGCFWGVQFKFDELSGVVQTEVGYMGGHTENPDYKKICQGDTNHAEVVKVIYDENTVSYQNLLNFFFQIHDPTTLNRQGPDMGTQYRSAVFTSDTKEAELVKDTIAGLQTKTAMAIVTSIETNLNYTAAEDYHQKYLIKNPGQCHI